MEVAATTVDSQCGSSQQATTLAAGLVGAGIEDLVLACGVEMMTRVPLGANHKVNGRPLPPIYKKHYAFASQFQGAETSANEFGGIRTAGASSQVSDGAAAVLLASPKRARELGLRPRARILATTLVGVDPVTMLKGPIPATRKVLAETGLSMADIAVFEVNEA